MNYNIDHDSPIPLHVQVEKLLRELISKDEYQKGKLLPGEKEMSKKLGISRNTFRAAMNKLVYEGLVVRKKGIGTKVNTKKVRTKLTAWSSFTHEMHSKGYDFHDLHKESDWVPAEEEVADYLDIEKNTEVMRLERLRGEQDYPIVLFISYFHPRVGIENSEVFNGPLYQILEEKYHVRPTISNEEIGAIFPNQELRRKLDVDSESPVLFRKRLVSDAAERPLEFCYAYYRADKFIYQLTIRRED